jgi:hypothetical protein
MLTAETASTTAKPRLIFPRNRNAGSFTGANCGLIPLENLTPTPLFAIAKPDLVAETGSRKTRVE